MVSGLNWTRVVRQIRRSINYHCTDSTNEVKFYVKRTYWKLFSKLTDEAESDCDLSRRTFRWTETICRKFPSASDIWRSVIFSDSDRSSCRQNSDRSTAFESLKWKSYEHSFSDESQITTDSAAACSTRQETLIFCQDSRKKNSTIFF